MENAQPLEAKATAADQAQPIAPIGRLSRRTIFIALTVAGVSSGLFWSWDWLVTVGLSSFLVALLPCAAMCAAGLCASRLGQKGFCSSSAATPPAKGTNGANDVLAA
ncbi:hypothetical protein, partial [Pelomicrobium sp. G1]|uniref:hypothetical protein n=1 Tax=Pelomicrobium sp. G1 TaxID=3452920 RepID=UPI003F7579D7